MKYKNYLGEIWLLLSSFGICFALLSSLEELSQGKYLKSIGALLLGIIIYITIARNKKETK